MASNSTKPNALSSSSADNLHLQTLMNRLNLRPPFLDTNSFLSQSLDEFILQDDDDVDDGGEEDLSSTSEARQRRIIAKEEAKLEKEIIRIVHSGNAIDALKPNSGQSVAIGDHNICVGFHEEAGSGFRVWEWHGHLVFFDEEDGYSAEYIYGNHFEKVREKERKGEEVENEEEKGQSGGNYGLKNLIGDGRDSVERKGGRVLHRNFLSYGSAAR